MGPDNTNPPTSSTPEQPVSPVQPLAPATPVAPVSQQGPEVFGQVPGMVAPAPAAAGPVGGGSKKTGLIIGIVAAVVALLLAVVFFVVMPMMTSVQAKGRSDAFMSKVTAGDATGALEYVNGPDQEDKDFIATVASQIKGRYKLKESTTKEGTFYGLYDLSGGSYVSARTELTQASGKWYVSGIVYDKQQLALVPGSSSKNDDTVAPTEDATTALACLEQDDYKWFEYDKQPSSVTFDSTYDPAKNTFNKVGNMFFKPDSTNEDSFTSIYDDWAEFATKNADKQWKFRLQGSTFGADSATAASKKLANERSEKVKSELVKRGVPAERVIIEAPKDYSNEEQDAMNEIYRRVQNTVDPNCTAAPASTGGNR